jgi:hypothetical protein
MAETFASVMEIAMRGFFALVALVFAGAGLYFLAWSGRRLALNLSVSRWHVTIGKVTASKVDINGDSNTYRYTPALIYEYQVAGHSYIGDQIHFATSGQMTPRQAQQQLAPYPPGARVQVYYRPSSPERAVLEPGFNRAFLLPFFLGAVFAVCGSVGALVALGLVNPEILFGWAESAWFEEMLFIALPYAALVAGLAVCGMALSFQRRIRASHMWPHARGKVVEADIASEMSSSSSVAGGRLYWPEIAFEYEVEGRVYIANTVRLVECHSSNPEPAERLVRRYPKGTVVDVRYDPADPSQALLEPAAAGVWLFWAVGLVFVFVASIFILIS